MDNVYGNCATTKDSMLKEFEERMGQSLNMRNLKNLRYYLRIQFERDKNRIFLLHQKTYSEIKFEKCKLMDSKPSYIPVDPGYQKRQEVPKDLKNKEIYRSANGALNYLATNTRHTGGNIDTFDDLVHRCGFLYFVSQSELSMYLVMLKSETCINGELSSLFTRLMDEWIGAVTGRATAPASQGSRVTPKGIF